MPSNLKSVDSAESFRKHKLMDKVENLENEMVVIKGMMCEMNKMLTELLQITPHRSSGWFGDIKTYPHLKNN